jgi:hypothetical protein
MRYLMLLAMLASLFPSPPPARAQDKPREAVNLQRVAEITDVTFEVQTTEPPNLIVTAAGNVPTGGWTEVQLLRREYLKPPADGIWEYDLLAKPPDGFATQVITSVKASDTWERVELDRLKGIRVYGLGDGIKTIRFDRK